MRKFITVILCAFLIVISVHPSLAQEGITTIESEYSVDETIDRLEKVLKENGLTIFKKVDHKEGAASVDMQLPPTTVLIFGNPKLGTPLMQCAPTVAIDLPQKVLVWESNQEQVHIGYNLPEYLKERHGIEGCDQELRKITGALKKIAQTAAGIL